MIGLATVKVWKGKQSTTDSVVVEEPLEIRVSHGPLTNRSRHVHSTAMRTPGDDHQLAMGLLFGDGVIEDRSDVMDVRSDGNEIAFQLSPDRPYDPKRYQRTGFTSSACGVCGQHTIDQVCDSIESIPLDQFTVSSLVIQQLPDAIRHRQSLFTRTGGSHAAAAFHASGECLALFEDVGRHNAMDKLIGHGVIQSLKFSDWLIAVSARASFELVQKAARAGVPILVAVGAPTSLAIELAERVGLTLIGFARSTEFNTYTHPSRITS